MANFYAGKRKDNRLKVYADTSWYYGDIVVYVPQSAPEPVPNRMSHTPWASIAMASSIAWQTGFPVKLAQLPSGGCEFRVRASGDDKRDEQWLRDAIRAALAVANNSSTSMGIYLDGRRVDAIAV